MRCADVAMTLQGGLFRNYLHTQSRMYDKTLGIRLGTIVGYGVR